MAQGDSNLINDNQIINRVSASFLPFFLSSISSEGRVSS